MFVRSPSGSRRIAERRRFLLYGCRFSSERGFVDRKIDGLDDASVGGNPVTGSQKHEISGYELPRGNDDFLAVAAHARVRRRHLLQRLERSSGAVFLDEPEEHRKQHNDRNDDCLERMAEEAGHDRPGEQNQNQDVLELGGQSAPRGFARRCFELVRAVETKALFGVRRGKTVEPSGQVVECNADRQGMPDDIVLGDGCCRGRFRESVLLSSHEVFDSEQTWIRR